jgi:hypothetical protein
MAWYKSKTFYLSLVLFVHVSLLDLFFVTTKGPVFLVDKNTEVKTLITHFVIVMLSVVFYVLLTKYREHARTTSFQISEVTWVVWSVALLFGIGFLVI